MNALFRLLVLSATILLLTGANAAAADTPAGLVYATSHDHTPANQPPNYWEVGVTSRPPPSGVKPAHATGQPDGRLTGWTRSDGALVLGFDAPRGLANVSGPDLFVWHFGVGGTRVFVSTDAKAPGNWQLIGELPTTEDHAVQKIGFEFGNLDKVFFVKFEKWQSGFWGISRFIDAVAGVPAP